MQGGYTDNKKGILKDELFPQFVHFPAAFKFSKALNAPKFK